MTNPSNARLRSGPVHQLVVQRLTDVDRRFIFALFAAVTRNLFAYLFHFTDCTFDDPKLWKIYSIPIKINPSMCWQYYNGGTLSCLPSSAFWRCWTKVSIDWVRTHVPIRFWRCVRTEPLLATTAFYHVATDHDTAIVMMMMIVMMETRTWCPDTGTIPSQKCHNLISKEKNYTCLLNVEVVINFP